MTLTALLQFHNNSIYALQNPDSVDIVISDLEGADKLNALMEASQSYYKTSLKLALRFANQRLDLAKSMANPVTIAESYNLCGNLYFNSGLTSQAEDHYFRAYAIYDSLDHFEGLSTECHNLALVYDSQGDTINALKRYNESVAVRKISGNTRRIGDGLTTLGEAHLNYGNFNTSLSSLYEAIRYYDNVSDYPRKMECIAFIVNNLLVLSPKEAPYWIKKLEEENSVRDSYPFKQMINLRWATYYLTVGDLDKSEEYISRVSTDSSFIWEVISPVNTFMKLADTFLDNGKTEKGLHYSRLARELHKNQEKHNTETLISEFKTRFNLRISEEELHSLNEINRLTADRIKIEERIKYIMIGALTLLTLLMINLLISHLSVRRNANMLSSRKNELEFAYEKNIKYKERILKTRSSKNLFFKMISGRLEEPFSNLTHNLEKLVVYSQGSIVKSQFTSRLKEIVSTGDYIEKNLKKILLWSKLQRGKYQIEKSDIKLNDYMHDLLPGILSMAVKNEVRVRFDINPELSVHYDRHSLKSIVYIMVENAVSQTPPKKDIIIRGQKGVSGAIISVTDFGKGIPATMQDKIFDIERAPKDNNGPLGISLLIARQLAELSGSWLSFHTTPGIETTFYLHITDNDG